MSLPTDNQIIDVEVPNSESIAYKQQDARDFDSSTTTTIEHLSAIDNVDHLDENIRINPQAPAAMAQQSPEASGGPRPWRILVLDMYLMPYNVSLLTPVIHGGGVRGLAELLILKRLMVSIRDVLVQNGVASQDGPLPLPCDWFDIVGGTSTGGLNAIMLGRLRMGIQDAIETFEELSPVIFPESRGWFEKAVRGFAGRPFFDGTRLEQAVKDLLLRQGLQENDPMLDVSNACKTFVCATRTQTSARIIFRSYVPRSLTNYEPWIWEAARATSAAPLFFAPFAIRRLRLTTVDGALRSNNPVDSAINEADNLDSSRLYGCVVSIGTGVSDVTPLNSRDITIPPLLRTCAEISINCHKVHEDFTESPHGLRLLETGRYYRFDVHRKLDEIDLDDWRRTEEVYAFVDNYIEQRETQLKFDACARTLYQASIESEVLEVIHVIARPLSKLGKSNNSMRWYPYWHPGTILDASTLPANDYITQKIGNAEQGLKDWRRKRISSGGALHFKEKKVASSENISLGAAVPAELSFSDAQTNGDASDEFQIRLADTMDKYWDQIIQQALDFPEHWQKAAVFQAMLRMTQGSIDKDHETHRNLLHWFAMNNAYTLIPQLVKAGFDVNARDSDYRTPLHLAVISNNFDSVVALVKDCHADTSVLDLREFLPWHLALAIDWEYRLKDIQRHDSKAQIIAYLAQHTDPALIAGEESHVTLLNLRQKPKAVIEFIPAG